MSFHLPILRREPEDRPRPLVSVMDRAIEHGADRYRESMRVHDVQAKAGERLTRFMVRCPSRAALDEVEIMAAATGAYGIARALGYYAACIVRLEDMSLTEADGKQAYGILDDRTRITEDIPPAVRVEIGTYCIRLYSEDAVTADFFGPLPPEPSPDGSDDSRDQTPAAPAASA